MLRYLLFVVMLSLPVNAFALSAGEVMKKSQEAFFYAGKDFKARVMMRLISKDGQERIRELTMLRKNYGDAGGNQRYFIYFSQPADVNGMTFMVYKYPAKDDDRWIFIPAINLVRRIAAQDKRSSFAGSDFTYEDISGRDIEEDAHLLVREEKIGQRDSYVIKSTPKAGDADYGYKLSWIDKATLLPLKEEYYNKQGEVYRVFTSETIADIKGLATATKRIMKNLKTGHRTEVTLINTDYNLGLDDSLFSERYLRQPPKKWIK